MTWSNREIQELRIVFKKYNLIVYISKYIYIYIYFLNIYISSILIERSNHFSDDILSFLTLQYYNKKSQILFYGINKSFSSLEIRQSYFTDFDINSFLLNIYNILSRTSFIIHIDAYILCYSIINIIM